MIALLLACSIPDAPTQLYGLWANVDENDFVRARDMAASHDETADLTPAYLIYNYDLGNDPQWVQAGRYDVLEEHIVTSPQGENVDYSNLIVGWGGDWFELEVDKATGDTRIYEAVDALP
ncbi:MAG: hypothetical protein GY884_19880 [Proteobacteria bacterium]|nr:hypothetical protein [Pseudomonadota bacterium]